MGRVRGRRRGRMFGAQISDDVGDLLIAERVREWRHFLSAIEDLAGHFVGRPAIVLADVDERRSLFGAGAIGAVAMGAALVAEEDGAGDLLFLVLVAPERMCGKWNRSGHEQSRGQFGKISQRGVHEEYFRILGRGRAPSKDGEAKDGRRKMEERKIEVLGSMNR